MSNAYTGNLKILHRHEIIDIPGTSIDLVDDPALESRHLRYKIIFFSQHRFYVQEPLAMSVRRFVHCHGVEINDHNFATLFLDALGNPLSREEQKHVVLLKFDRAFDLCQDFLRGARAKI